MLSGIIIASSRNSRLVAGHTIAANVLPNHRRMSGLVIVCVPSGEHMVRLALWRRMTGGVALPVIVCNEYNVDADPSPLPRRQPLKPNASAGLRRASAPRHGIRVPHAHHAATLPHCRHNRRARSVDRTDREYKAMGDFRREVLEWESVNLGLYYQYIGQDLRAYGFPYKPGEFIPVDARYSAMLMWRAAERRATQ